MQIIEQILPLFNPDHTLKIRAIPELNLITNVPISLSSISIQDDYDGEYTTHRLVVYTLSFTIKMEYYGEVQNKNAVFDVTFNVDNGTGLGQYVVTSDLENGEQVIDEWSWDTFCLDSAITPANNKSSSVEISTGISIVEMTPSNHEQG